MLTSVVNQKVGVQAAVFSQRREGQKESNEFCFRVNESDQSIS